MEKEQLQDYLFRKVRRDRLESERRRTAKLQKQTILRQISNMNMNNLNFFIRHKMNRNTKNKGFNAIVDSINKRLNTLREEAKMERAYNFFEYSEDEQQNTTKDEFKYISDMITVGRKTQKRTKKVNYQDEMQCEDLESEERENDSQWEKLEWFQELENVQEMKEQSQQTA